MSYSNDPSDYNQRRSNAQRASSNPYMQELNDSYGGRYNRTRAVNLNRDSYTKNRTVDDEISSVYSRSSVGTHSRLGKNGFTDSNGHNRLQLINGQQQYETDEDNSSSTQTNSFNTRSSVALTSYDHQEKAMEMGERNSYNDHKIIPGQHDVYNDFNNNYDNSHRGMTDSNDGLTDSTNGFEVDYTDRDFPGGGRSARQSKIGEDFVIDKKERKSRCCCCSRKTCVIVTFIVLAIIAVCLYFVWPRIPQVSIDGSKTTQTPNTKPTLSENPPLVNLSMNVQVLIDNSENWVPYKFNLINVQVYDSNTLSTNNRPIATGNVTDYTLEPRATSTLQIPILVFYQPSQITDPTFQDFVGACIRSPASNGTQNLLNFQVDVTISIAGIDWIYKPSFSVPVSNFKCPYSLLLGQSS